MRRFYELATQEAPAEARRRRQRDAGGPGDEEGAGGEAPRGGWGDGPWPGWGGSGDVEGDVEGDVDRLMEAMLGPGPAGAQ